MDDFKNGRRESDTVYGASDLPAWAKVIGIIGVPSAIALFLVYNLAAAQTIVTSDIVELNKKMEVHSVQLAEHRTRSEQAIIETMRYLRQICINTSKGAETARNCQ